MSPASPTPPAGAVLRSATGAGPSAPRTRYALVGTGSRAEMFVRELAGRHRDSAELVAFADVNQIRMDAHNRLLQRCGADAVPTYPVTGFRAMLDRERVDKVLVTSVDRTHDEYIVAALEAGRDVITEKPMTVDADRCRRILSAVRRTGRHVTVTFNYRYNPVHEAVRQLLASGEIGEIGSVHFEWLLDVRHGADYFRRWHRDKANSGGLLVHKASHHFDLVNWWLGGRPVEVYAAGRLFFYGAGGVRHGYDRGYDRAHGASAARDDPFAVHLADHPRLRELYLDAEGADGYLRDRSVFAPGISIEDDMAVLVRYDTGATMSYHLTAYAPWEGYRLMVNGSRGRLELEVVESDRVDPVAGDAVKGESHAAARRLEDTAAKRLEDTAARRLEDAGATPDELGEQDSAALHGAVAAAEQGWLRLSVRRFWEPPREIEVPGYTRAGHGGADVRMADALFGPPAGADPLGRGASAQDGALALLTGLAANASMVSGRPVLVRDVLDLESR